MIWRWISRGARAWARRGARRARGRGFGEAEFGGGGGGVGGSELQAELQDVIYDAAYEGYMTALDMCGNDGQISVIEMTGAETWEVAIAMHLRGEDGRLYMDMACPYPEAVGQILDETFEMMVDMVEQATADIIEAYVEEAEENVYEDE